MTTRTTKLALLSTASVAAAAFALPSAAAAQTVCQAAPSPTSTAITCINNTVVVATGTTNATAGPGIIAAQGLNLSSTGDQTTTLNVTGQYITNGDNAVRATSGGAINLTVNGVIKTDGIAGAGDAYVLNPTTTLNAQLGDIFTYGSNAFGVNASGGTNLSISTGTIGTFGGGNAIGVLVTGNTGTTNITTGNVVTTGEGIVVSNGSTAATTINAAGVTTLGDNYDAILVNTQGNVSVTAGAVKANGLDSDGVNITTPGAVTTNIASIETTGDDSVGLLISGGAGNVQAGYGTITTGGTGASYPVLITTTSGNINVAGTSVAAFGADQIGIQLNSTSGAITGSTGNITMVGANGRGLVVNGAGGGIVNLTTGNLLTTDDAVVIDNGADAITLVTGTGTTSQADAPVITLTSTGPITLTTGALKTTGANSFGVLVNGGAGAINTNVASVTTDGANADGIVLNGTGTITSTSGPLLVRGADAAGLVINGGAGAITANYGNITTLGTGAANALLINSTGTVALNGTGTLRTDGAGVTAAVINSAGVTGNLGNVTTTGAGSQGAVITSTAPVNLTVGTVTTTGNALTVNAGTNNVTLTTGAVTASELGATGTRINSTGAIAFNGGLQRANGADALQINGGAGAITATVAGANTTGANADGVQIAGTGAVTFTNSGTITTTGATSRGVAISAGTGTIACGNITTSGAGSTACDVAAAGNTTVTGGTISTTGAGADGINVVNTAGTTTVTGGTTTVSGAGSIGIDVATTGTGAVTVNTGVVTSTATNAAAAPDFAAVRVVSGGPVTVNATGNVSAAAGSGIWAQSASTSTVVVNSGVTVQGPTAITLGGATGNTLTVNGTIRSTTTGAPAYAVVGGPLTLTLGANGSIVGPLAFTAGNDTFINNNANYVQTGTIDFLAGNDTFTNNGGFTHGGIIQFGAGADVLNNNGTFNASSAAAIDFGADADVFNNAGTLNLRDGARTLANLETFNNLATGLIDLRDGAANDTLTISGNYVATSGARLGIDVVGNGTVLTADRLVIGGTTTGTTTVLANIINPVVDPTGALIVDSTLNNIGAGAFVLGNAANGLINYSLVNRSGDVFLVSNLDPSTLDQLFVGRIGSDLWYQSAEAYQAYAMSRRIDYGNERKHPLGIWAQLYGSRDKYGDSSRSVSVFNTTLTSNNRFETNRRGAQAGLDFGASNFLVGVTAGYEHAKGDSSLGTELDAEGYNYGAYAQFGAKQGLYAGVLLKRDTYDLRVANNAIALGSARPDGRSTGIDGEVGFRFGNPGGINFDVGAGLSYVKSKIDDYSFGNVNFDDAGYKSTRGRLQARATFAGAIAPFVDGKIFHEFSDNNAITVSSGNLVGEIDDGKRGTWGRVEAGLGGGAGGGPLLSAWVDVGNVRGWGIRGGFRF